ncbi:methyltransferase domain-containing protein [Intestinimonas massiliensis (ex Afouda et al. 2020)]|uniref:methyltransferase domain-containing protein n=1 Tax=Intestinimonas massiliensis (ex Afouda et al. 2020) TaxID=1673721 RepID=UPI000AFD0356|nr:methyltransferase domain-containing protein [Intestinimonas massiliensis (ex Afouda et al. 2020)]
MKKEMSGPARFYQAIRDYQETQLLFTAIQMDIFSFLDAPATVDMIAERISCPPNKVELLLFALTSCGLIEKQGDFFVNTENTRKYLSRHSPVYLGENILFREKMTSLSDLKERLEETSGSKQQGYDFEELARVTIPEMYAGRVQSFIEGMQGLYPDKNKQLRILDLGGGTGILAIEFSKHFPNSSAVVFERPDVATVTKEIILQYHAEKQVDVLAGDFNSDDLGGSYDLIIASGILNFVRGDMSAFMKKLSSSLNEGGYLLIVGQFSDHNYDVPQNMISWLSGFLDGVPLPPSSDVLNQALKNAGLRETERKCGLSCLGVQLNSGLFQGKIYQKGGIYSDDVIRSFIELTERIANSKTNVLDFGSKDMTFYRGEIHLVKMIGDFPGIHSAELARKFGITRPVVHKTLQKLIERDLIRKEAVADNKKLHCLYLTDKGKLAYRYHAEYHDKYDKALFSYLSDMNDDQLTAILGFLERAINLIQNHA